MAERQQIEIDYCPKCRGVWLDRGELDKIIERSAAETPDGGRAPEGRRSIDPHSSQGYFEERHGSKHGGHGGHGRRHESFLSRLFD